MERTSKRAASKNNRLDFRSHMREESEGLSVSRLCYRVSVYVGCCIRVILPPSYLFFSPLSTVPSHMPSWTPFGA